MDFRTPNLSAAYTTMVRDDDDDDDDDDDVEMTIHTLKTTIM